jgi:hypothetical protein
MLSARTTRHPCNRQCQQYHSNPFILAAEGYAAISMFSEAHHQLDLAEMMPEWRITVAAMKLDLFMREHCWAEAAIYGALMCDLMPDNPDHFKKYATAMQALGKKDEALCLLRQHAETFHWDPEYHYCLGKLEVTAGAEEPALYHISQAIASNSIFRKVALCDPELVTIWDKLPLAS